MSARLSPQWIARIDTVLPFLAEIEAPGFVAMVPVTYADAEPGVIVLPAYEFSPVMSAFVQAFDPDGGLPDLSAFENPEDALIAAATSPEWQALKNVMAASFDPYALKALGTELFADTMAEQRTGATRYNQGLDANTLNKTASGINMIQNAAAQRIELIARIYAETGVKRAFRRILQLVCQHQQKARMIRLRNTWVEMDPRGWRDSMDMTVSVGLGNGNRGDGLRRRDRCAKR